MLQTHRLRVDRHHLITSALGLQGLVEEVVLAGLGSNMFDLLWLELLRNLDWSRRCLFSRLSFAYFLYLKWVQSQVNPSVCLFL